MDQTEQPLDSGLEIRETKVVAGTLGVSPESQSAASAYTTKADPTREYVAGGGWSWYNNSVRTLPWSIDDITDDFGDDLYEQMLKDPTVLSCLNVLKTAILSGGLSFSPFQASSSEPVPPLAQEMADFVSRVLGDLETPMDSVLWNMLDALAFGNKVAELVFTIAYRSKDVEVQVEIDEEAETEEEDAPEQPEVVRPVSTFARLARQVYMALVPGAKPEDLPDPEQPPEQPEEDEAPEQPMTTTEKISVTRPYLELVRIKVKPRRATAFIVDPFMNVIGVLGLMPGQFNGVMSGSMFMAQDQTPPNMLPRSKFAVLTFRPKDSDPRGSSILRAAYNAWWLKRQVWPEYLKYLVQFASSSLVGFTAPDEDFVAGVDELGMPIEGSYITAEQAMLNSLLKLRNGSAAVFKNGSDVKPLVMQGEGGAFLNAIELFNTEIVTAVLHQKLAVMDSEHNTRAAASVHQDTLQTVIRQARNAVCQMIRRDIVTPLIRFNWGDDATAWAPKPTLGETDQVDFAAIANAVSALMKAGYFDPSQMQEIDVMLGLPPRPQESVDQQNAAKQAGYQLASKVASGEIDLSGGEDQ